MFGKLYACKMMHRHVVCSSTYGLIYRHCLWILGNSATLVNSHSIWKKLVLDTKARGCFHNARDSKILVQAISSALIELGQFDNLLSTDSVLFKTARWKVCLSCHTKVITWSASLLLFLAGFFF